MRTRLLRTRNRADSVTYRAESIALFAAHAVQLTTPQKIVVNSVIDQWITDSVWLEADYIGVPCLVTEQQSLLNWKSPGGTVMIPSGFASSFVSKVGYPANSANSTYINLGWTPSTNGVKFSLNNGKILIYSKNNLQDDGYAVGAIGGSNGDMLIVPRNTSNQFVGRVSDSASTDSSITDGSGLLSAATPDGANIVKKRNNTTISTTASAVSSLNTRKQFLYAWNDGGDVPAHFCNGNTFQLVIFGSSSINDASVKSGVEYILANL